VGLEGSVTRTAAQRLAGERATRPRAFLAASVAGVAVGIAVYRLLRSGSEPGS
jgi:hypothetical protein